MHFHSFSLYRQANNIFIDLFLIAVNWLTSGFVYATLPLSQLTRRLQTMRKNLTSEERASK